MTVGPGFRRRSPAPSYRSDSGRYLRSGAPV
jgi:hypothetical protein